jgi:hypothetical protein
MGEVEVRTPPSTLAFGIAAAIAVALGSLAGAAGWALLSDMPAAAVKDYLKPAVKAGFLQGIALLCVAARADGRLTALRWVEALGAALCVAVLSRGIVTGSDAFVSTTRFGSGSSSVESAARDLTLFLPMNACWLGLGVGYALACRARGRLNAGLLLVAPYAIGLVIAMSALRGAVDPIFACALQSLALCAPTVAVLLPLLERALGRALPE